MAPASSVNFGVVTDTLPPFPEPVVKLPIPLIRVGEIGYTPIMAMACRATTVTSPAMPTPVPGIPAIRKEEAKISPHS